MINQSIVNIAYLIAAVLFILGLKGLGHPRTAVRGNLLGAIGMLLAVVVTLLDRNIVGFEVIIAGFVIGAALGAVLAMKVQMTAMPEMVGLFNGFGGGASVLVAGAALVYAMGRLNAFLEAGGNPADFTEAGMQMKIATVASAIIGSVTFFGSYVAFGKLAEFLVITALLGNYYSDFDSTTEILQRWGDKLASGSPETRFATAILASRTGNAAASTETIAESH